MELDNITYEEIEPLVLSLAPSEFYEGKYGEGETYTIPLLKGILKAEYVTAVRIDGELAGIATLERSSPIRLLHSSLWITNTTRHVKPEFQGKGVGTQLEQNCVNYAKEKGYVFMTAMVDSINISSVRIHHKLGLKIYCSIKGIYLMCLPLNRKGKLASKFLLPIIVLYWWLNEYPLGFIRAHWPHSLKEAT